ncbi:MAG: hypothetical protein MOB07_31335 [Acidobacteria bacterium]|nr:hypothetical protein [Acidobacteriota bacterium]
MSIITPPEESISNPFVCDCEKWMRSACASEGFYKEHEGKRYCVLHYPGEEKTAAFNVALKKKFDAEDFDFCGAWFPESVNFASKSFGENANFSWASFSADASFSRASFSENADFFQATFKDEANFSQTAFLANANFSHAVFSGKANFFQASYKAEADFSQARFRQEVSFSWAAIWKAHFSEALFTAKADFWNITFDEADFSLVSFGTKANFLFAKFNSPVNFSDSHFDLADFNHADFHGGGNFHNATFAEKANFSNAGYDQKADFSGATFTSEANFSYAVFRAEVDFSHAVFNAEANFFSATFETAKDFSFAIFKTGANLLSAYTITLRPHWFVNSDARKFDLTNVDWAPDSINEGLEKLQEKDREINRLRQDLAHIDALLSSKEKVRPVLSNTASILTRLERLPQLFEETSDHSDISRRVVEMDKEIATLKEQQGEIERAIEDRTTSLRRLLAKAYREIAINCEENHRYETASQFRYWAMDVQRRGKFRGFACWRLNWWYWLASGYGERMLRATTMLILLWLAFTLSYTQVGFARWEPKMASESDSTIAKSDEQGAPLNFKRASVYSLGVMALQKPEPKPATLTAQILVLLETILGPLQAALLALAIRRKFMR